MEWRCASPRADSCLEAFSGLGPEEKGRARTLLMKAGLGLGLGDIEAFTLAYRRPPSGGPGEAAGPARDGEAGPDPETTAPRFVQALVRTREGWYTVARRGAEDGTLCATREGGGTTCLEEPAPRSPLRRSGPSGLATRRPPVLAFPAGTSEAIHPVLPGKVVALPADTSGWVKVHHGGNLFSYYGGYAGLHPALRPGNRVAPEDTLGYTAPADSTGAPVRTLRLRIEKDGAPLDPLAFLGLGTDTAGVSRAP
jgi:hypothetical protein